MTGNLRIAAPLVLIALGMVGFWWVAKNAPPSDEEQWAMLEEFCVDCHNDIDRTADLAFDTLTMDSIHEDPALWEEVVLKLRGRMMPPPGRTKPSAARYDAFVAWAEDTLDAAAGDTLHPGEIAIHRLNRNEYANAIEDLFSLRLDAGVLLPKDDESDGFDNVASVLKVSPSFLEQYIDAARVVAATAVGNSTAKFDSRAYFAEAVNQTRHVAGMPLGTRGGMLVEHFFPVDGLYEFSISGLVSAGYTIGMEYRHHLIMTIDGRRVFEHELGGEDDLKFVDQNQAPAVAALREPLQNIRVPVTAGPHEVGVTFVARSFAESDEIFHPFLAGGGEGRIMAPRRLEIEGPFEVTGLDDTPSRERILICKPETPAEETACAERIFANIARRAFRRDVTREDLAAPMGFYAASRETGDFEAGIRGGLVAILASPKFLYRAEIPPAGLTPGDAFAISDFELASRLSFFLWSRLPDKELLDVAAQGRLTDAQVLADQVARMLADPRAISLVKNFAFQWLRLREIDDIDPDGNIFPQFDRELRNAFETELELFLASIFLENHSILELLSAKHTFVNERLALHYGIDAIRGDRFRRVELEDPNRYGLLGKGGVLMVTSYPNRTAPVLRGAWILETLLGTPAPSPPPNVEALPETQEGEIALTVRERLEVHRRNPSCNGCHGVMDGLGFALENFDAVGQWRTKDRFAGEPIDSSGVLADGSPVSGPQDLNAALLARPDLLAQSMTEKLLIYALGRGIDYRDMPTVRRIVDRARDDDYRFGSILSGIVMSDAFRMNRLADSERNETAQNEFIPGIL
jgi:hypothetical protein